MLGRRVFVSFSGCSQVSQVVAPIQLCGYMLVWKAGGGNQAGPRRPLGLGLSNLGTRHPSDCPAAASRMLRVALLQAVLLLPLGHLPWHNMGPRLANVSKDLKEEAGLWPATMPTE